MTAGVGQFSLSLALLAAMSAILVAIASVRFDSQKLLDAAGKLIIAFAALIGISSIALTYAMVTSNFSIEYVAHYSERAMPFGYKLAAFWAGQEGSILLWALLVAVMSAILVATRRDLAGGEGAAVIVTLASVCLFFAAVLLFAADPFKVSPIAPTDGRGLNPLLQDPAMIAHPPMLFLGYAGFTIPFALLIGALVAGRRDSEWLAGTRRWILASWLFLTVGIVLGAWWAYIELGWGGYWAWDPVENASLLPWLTGTALLHSIMPQQHRGMFKKWNATLIAMSFLLCIVATWITRSGVIQSVHAFGESPIGTFFLSFLAVGVVVTAIMMIVRRRELRSEQELEGLVGREGAFLATNFLLVGMMLVTLIGTLFPVISQIFAEKQVTVRPDFYNKVVAPMGMLLVALMALGPALVYGDMAARVLRVRSIVPAIVAVATAVGAWFLGLHNHWALLASAIVGWGVSCIVQDFLIALTAHVRGGGNPLTAIIRIVDANHRRYGGQLTHLGMMMILAGIVGSSVFNEKTQLEELRPGQSAPFAGQTLTLDKIETVPMANYTAVIAQLHLTDAAGKVTRISPQQRRYNKAEQPNAEVSITSDWKRDLYVTLAGADPDGQVAALEAIVNPLVSWIWIGGLVMTAGALLGLTPRLLGPKTAGASAPVQVVPLNVRSNSKLKAAV